jgi:hypothetical protein
MQRAGQPVPRDGGPLPRSLQKEAIGLMRNRLCSMVQLHEGVFITFCDIQGLRVIAGLIAGRIWQMATSITDF